MIETLHNQLLTSTVVHGRAVCSSLLYDNPNPLPKVSISNEVHIITIVDRYGEGSMCVNKSNLDDGRVNIIILEEYNKWISKIEGLRDYIKTNYDNLPDYILYLDAFDTLILKDIKNPQEYLNYYNCKVLFNSEPSFHHTGFPQPDGASTTYYDKLYYEGKSKYVELNKNKYGLPFDNGLNAGVFLGEKAYILNLLEECYSIMKDSYDKGFPYGCQDDQCTLRFLHNQYFDNISVDLFNKFFFWGCPQTFTQPDSIYGINYFKKYNYEYSNRMVSL